MKNHAKTIPKDKKLINKIIKTNNKFGIIKEVASKKEKNFKKKLNYKNFNPRNINMIIFFLKLYIFFISISFINSR